MKVQKEICVKCRTCTSVCPVEAISIDSDENICFDEEKCVQCGTCVSTCPFGAIKED